MRPGRHTARVLATAAAGALVLLPTAGCGREEDPNLVRGKELFVQKCGACHKLARAGTSGVQAPDLDAAFAAALEAGMDRQTVEGVVDDQIKNVRRNSSMPADLVTGESRLDVAAYVAYATSRPGEDTGELAQAGKPKTSSRPVRARNGTLDIDADPGGGLAFTASRATAPAGAIQLVMDNESSIEHNIAVKDGGFDRKGPVVDQGGVSKLSVNLDPGRFTFYCSVPGHEEGGMKGTLTVR